MPSNFAKKTASQGDGFNGDRAQKPQAAQQQIPTDAFSLVSQGTNAQAGLNGLLLNNDVALVEQAEAEVDDIETQLAQRLAVAYHPDLSASRILTKTVNFLATYGRNAVDRTSSAQPLDLQPVPQLQLVSLASMYDQRTRQESKQLQSSDKKS